MAYILRMPKLGLEMSSGTLLEWHVEEGESVEEGDPIATVESEKTQAEVEAREAGVLRRRDLAAGERCEPGDPIGILAGEGEDVSDLEATLAEELDAAPPIETEREAGEPPASGGDRDGGGETVKATPPARGRAEELGVDLASVAGTGPDGAVTEADVEAAAETVPEESGGREGGPTLREERSLSGTRRTIAERLSESYRNAVHVTERRTVDAGALLDAADDADVAVTDVLLAAVSEALDVHPEFNAHFEEGTHRLYEEHNVCVAVDTEQGLIAPVVRDVAAKSVDEIAATRRDLTDRVLADEHTMADLAGGTFTITNLGPFGIESFDPIINPPQVAILGINAVDDAVVAGADGDVTVRKRLPLNLSFDHRVVDGADAARFLATLADRLEAPGPLVGGEGD